MRRLHLLLLVVLLVGAGSGIFVYKWQVLEFPLIPGERAFSWKLELRADIDTDGAALLFATFVPQTEGRFGLTYEAQLSQGLGLTRTEDDLGNRLVVWSGRNPAGSLTVFWQADVYRFSTRFPSPDPRPDLFATADLSALGEAEQTAMALFVDDLQARSANLETLVARLAERLNATERLEHEQLLFGQDLTTARRADLAQTALRMAGVPARAVHGVALEELSRDAPLGHWLEYWDGSEWQARLLDAAASPVPDNRLPIWRGGANRVEIEGGRLRHLRLSYAAQSPPAIAPATLQVERRQSLLGQLTLYHLPVETQAIYRVLLLIPVGALVVVFLRQVIGIRTFGTFMPVLIALSFRETALVGGLVLFSLIVAAGLSFRFYFERLKLLFVPRLSAVLTIVVLLLAASSVALESLRLGSGLSVALFPIVILAMVIERMSIVWEEYGPLDAMKEAVGSVFAAVLAYYLMNLWPVEHLVFTFPELLLILLAIILLFGRYTGFRLVELWRFRSLSRAR